MRPERKPGDEITHQRRQLELAASRHRDHAACEQHEHRLQGNRPRHGKVIRGIGLYSRRMIKAAPFAKNSAKKRSESNALDLARRVLAIEAEAVRALAARLDERFVAALELIAGRSGRVVVSGTGNPDSPLAREADVNLDAAVGQEACPLNLAPTASTTAALALGDALAVALLEARGFSAADFARTHPRGKLPRQALAHQALLHVH